MAHLDIAHMTESPALQQRITACAATLGQRYPELWTHQAIWHVCASPGWDDTWAYMDAAWQQDHAGEDAPDHGANPAGIIDAAILAAVAHVIETHPGLGG